MKTRRVTNIAKGWGLESVIVNSNRYCGKILEVRGGRQGSLHFHMQKYETFYLLSGRLEIETRNPETGDAELIEMLPGDILDIPSGFVHRIRAPENSRLIEISTTHFDNDSFRVMPGDSQI